MTIGQLQQLAHLLALGALTESDPKKRIAMVRLADELVQKERAVARWRGHSVRGLELPQAVRDGRAAVAHPVQAEQQAA